MHLNYSYDANHDIQVALTCIHGYRGNCGFIYCRRLSSEAQQSNPPAVQKERRTCIWPNAFLHMIFIITLIFCVGPPVIVFLYHLLFLNVEILKCEFPSFLALVVVGYWCFVYAVNQPRLSIMKHFTFTTCSIATWFVSTTVSATFMKCLDTTLAHPFNNNVLFFLIPLLLKNNPWRL